MEISLNTRLYGKILTVKDTNVLLEEDVEERIYEKDENGKQIGQSLTEGIFLLNTWMNSPTPFLK